MVEKSALKKVRIFYCEDIYTYLPSLDARPIAEGETPESYILELFIGDKWIFSKGWLMIGNGKSVNYTLITEISRLISLGYEVDILGSIAFSKSTCNE